MDFQRNPVAFGPMSMMQRIQAESRLHHHQAAAAAAASIASLGKNAREVAENLYDGTDNGSFLDGIIRSSLETGLKSAAAMAAVQAAAKNATKGGSGEGSGGDDDCSRDGSLRVGGAENDGDRHMEDLAATPPSCQDSAADSDDEKPRTESPDGQEHRHQLHDDSEHETNADRASSASPEHATETENDDDDNDAVV